jgi:triacylglycerol lipase
MLNGTFASRAARRGGVLLAILFLTACGADGLLTAPGRSDARIALAPPAHDPIIFVHGYNANSATWTTMYNRFKAAGYTDAELVNWSYDYKQSNATTAQKLSAKVDSVLAATGAYHVDIITHSMGALSARYYVRNSLSALDRRVDALVTLGGTNHGTSTAWGCLPIACVEMRTYSTFTSRLNSVDETWGAPRYGTWWSPCDEVILPQKSAVLSGAKNTQTACIRHSQLHESATVFAQVRDFVKFTPLLF